MFTNMNRNIFINRSIKNKKYVNISVNLPFLVNVSDATGANAGMKKRPVVGTFSSTDPANVT